MAHVGFLKALEDIGVQIGAISGTSIGSLVGIMYASGMSTDDIFEMLQNWNLSDRRGRGTVLKLMWSRKMELLYDKLAEAGCKTDFSGLDITCYVAASNLDSAQCDVFNRGNCLHAALASCSIPVVFRNYRLNNCEYVDGGLFNNFPVDPLLSNCTHILGSNVNHISYQRGFDSPWKVADRMFKLAVFQNVNDRLALCDWYADPPKLRDYTMFDFDSRKVKALYEIGYQSAITDKDIIQAVLSKKSIKQKARSEFSSFYPLVTMARAENSPSG